MLLYELPPALRAEMKTPFGAVHSTESAVPEVRDRFLVAVGDVCAEQFVAAGVTPRVIVADWKTQRGKEAPEAGGLANLRALQARAESESDIRLVRVENPAATITRELWDAVESSFSADRITLIEVDGEEDLATLPAIVLAPDGAVVAYGQPNEGVVLVPVNAEARDRARDYLERMKANRQDS